MTDRAGAEDVSRWTDRYFLKTKETIERFGDKKVTYAVFMRRPVIFTPNLMVAWLERVAGERGVAFDIELNYAEGQWAGAGEPLLYITGSFYHLVDLETLYLQKLGACCVAAYNAYTMCVDLPDVAFLAMDARHCAGTEMADMMAYAASVGSSAAQAKTGARGFIGTANDATAHYFGQERGLGTMPHALIGYAGSTLAAAEMTVEAFPGQDLTVLVDYYGTEITDSLAVCRRFPDLAAVGHLSVRLDTHGGRFVEGLDPQASYAVLERHVPQAVRPLPRRHRIAPPHRYRGVGGGHLPVARETGRGRLRVREDHRLVGLQRQEMQGHGGGPRPHGRHRDGLLPARILAGDKRHRRHHRLRRGADGQGRPGIPAQEGMRNRRFRA